ncbi:glycosyltransferase family 4 protein [Rhodobacteraceae bacterium KMM 6894]|nr:glycosyltransferase family 4 protein [Rhodobacteraceae bacterium KMM 6894]
MRIAITHPTSWPWVRRGSERLLNDLSLFLARRGHDVTIVTTSPEGRSVEMRDGIRWNFVPKRLSFLKQLRQINGFHAFAFDCARVVKDSDFDAVHCLGYHEAWGILGQRSGGRCPRVIYQMTGIPLARYFRSVPLDKMMFNQVARRADGVICLSKFARECMKRDFGRDSLLIPSPTETTPFLAAPRVKYDTDRILFSGDADEPRKGALLLAQSFARLNRAGTELHFSGRCSSATEREIRARLPHDMQNRVVFHGLGRVEDLPALYASAAVAVNPAVWEALGNVLIEALAAGTPVVGCDHGGIPDIINTNKVGAMFAPEIQGSVATNVEGLTDALGHGLNLARRPETAELCRKRADAFSWNSLGPAYEAALMGERAEMVA